jgi:hypothetical protein
VQEEEVILIILSLMIFAGLVVLWLAMWNRRAIREMEHRERLAMIQHGVLPPPEADPLAFEAHMETAHAGIPRHERWRTAGTLTIGLGIALLILLSFTGEPQVGFGVGGAFAVLGVAFFVNGLQLGRPAPRQSFPTLAGRRPAAPPPDSSAPL